MAKTVETVKERVDQVVEKLEKLEKNNMLAPFGGVVPQMESQVSQRAAWK